MRKRHLTLAAVCLFFAQSLFSQQWTGPSANNEISTTYKVLVGSGTPSGKQLEVFGDARFEGILTTSGAVGIGTSTPGANANLGGFQEALLHLVSTQNKNSMLLVQNVTNDLNVAPLVRTMADVASQNFQSHASSRTISRFGETLGGWNEFLAVSGNGLIFGTLGATPLILGTGNATRLHISGTGNVGIGMTAGSTNGLQNRLDVSGNAHVTGHLVVDGNIAAKYQDVAEWVPASGELMAGMVVIVAPDATNTVVISEGAYDTRIAGVVASQPGLILGEAGASKVMVATTGRVKVKVDASEPIRAGDLLVSSDKPGMAMKSRPVELEGVKFHRPGTVIGKALEPLSSGEGEILVLLSLQ